MDIAWNAVVTQSLASDYESGGREFESSPVRQFFIIFQRIKNLHSDLSHFCRATFACGPGPDISTNPNGPTDLRGAR